MKLLVREFCANLTADIDDPNSPAVSQVYVRGQVIAFSLANIVDFLSWLHYANIKGNGLDYDLEIDEVAKGLKGDGEAQWPDNIRLPSALLSLKYRALYKVSYGYWIPNTNVTIVLKEMALLMYAFP